MTKERTTHIGIEPQLTSAQTDFSSPLRSLAIVAISIFTIEVALMFIVRLLPTYPDNYVVMLDGILLTIFVLPILYFFLFQPLNFHIVAFQKFHGLLQQHNDNLEQEVQIRTAEVITQNKKLAESEHQFRSLVEQSLAGIFMIGDGRFVYANPRCVEILGYADTKELVGVEALSLVVEDERDILKNNSRRLLDGKKVDASQIFTAIRKDGSLADIGIHYSWVTRNGQPMVIGLMQDVSEKKVSDELIKRQIKQLEQAFTSSIEMASKLLDLRDPYTAGHEVRVAQIAVDIGIEMELSANIIEGLRVGGHVHDIGKIIVPSEILSKPGKLSAIEYELIKGHPQAGYDILKNVNFPWPVAKIAYQHHERMDGSGYPNGLKGEEIILEARITAVADVIEAMSSHRPYRPGFGIEKALAEIERGRGGAYDPQAVDACLRLFREKGKVLSS